MKRHLEPIPGAGAGPMFNQILNGRFGDVLTRMLWIRSAGAPAPTLTPEIQPGLDVNQQDDPTVNYLRNESLWSAGGALAAPGAGNTSKLGIANPVNSGVLVTVDRIDYSVDLTGGDIILERMASVMVGGNLFTVNRRDTRFTWNVPATACIGATDALAVPQAGSLFILARHLGAAVFGKLITIDQPGLAILKPGTTFRVGCTLPVTPQLYCTFYGRERALTAEESSTG